MGTALANILNRIGLAVLAMGLALPLGASGFAAEKLTGERGGL
jgi:hypothetical protein